MGRLFGTDGARGVANTELTCELAMNIGRAAAMVLTEESGRRAKIVIGKDTRISSNMLEAAIAAGFCSVGADVLLLGVVPTPAVALLVDQYGADAGVMISASHNPAKYNGIKLFNRDGFKLPDATEEEIEAILLDGAQPYPQLSGGELGTIQTAKHAVSDYISWISKAVEGSLEGIHVALDCANGSASATAKRLFQGLGAQVDMLHDRPNGLNINDQCGSTHLDSLCQYVRTHRCHLGLAFDGDADRCLAVDETGEPVDGDKMIAILASYLKEEGNLKQNTAVVTVMSNLGFFEFAEKNGIQVEVTKVGDRYVLERMLEAGFNIGGEQSGHIILTDYAHTGDGQLSGLLLASVLCKTGKKLSQLAALMERYPQVIVNNKISNDRKSRCAADPEITALVEQLSQQLGKEGRILVRASGTEPLIRVMVEGKHFDEINEIALAVSEKIKERLG